MVATIQGRPLGIRDETFDVELPTLQTMQTEIENQSLPPDFKLSMSETASYSLRRFKLDKIISEIKTVFYFLPNRINPSIWSTDYAPHQQRIQHELDSWYADSSDDLSRPRVLDMGGKRWHIHLEQQYQAARVLLFQPSQVFRQPSDESLQHCFEAASRQIDCYNSLYEDLDMLHFDFRTIRSIFACGATVIYCFWTSKALQLSSCTDELPKTLRLCTTLLAVGSIWWPSVKKGRSSFQRLVDLTLQRLTDLQKRDLEQGRKKRSNRSKQGNGLDLPFQIPSTLTGVPGSQAQSSFHPIHSTHNEQFVPGVPLQVRGLEEESPGQWQTFDPLDYNNMTNDRDFFSNSEFENPSPYNQIEIPGHIEPEIATFLNDYFLDDGSWNSAEAGPPLSFHFGNL